MKLHYRISLLLLLGLSIGLSFNVVQSQAKPLPGYTDHGRAVVYHYTTSIPKSLRGTWYDNSDHYYSKYGGQLDKYKITKKTITDTTYERDMYLSNKYPNGHWEKTKKTTYVKPTHKHPLYSFKISGGYWEISYGKPQFYNPHYKHRYVIIPSHWSMQLKFKPHTVHGKKVKSLETFYYDGEKPFLRSDFHYLNNQIIK